MSALDNIRFRVADAIAMGVLTIVIAAIATAFQDVGTTSGNLFSSEAYTILRSLTLVPFMATLIGLAISTFRGGPFGFFGFMLEWAGVNSLLANPASNDFGIIVIGAVFVVIGSILVMEAGAPLCASVTSESRTTPW